GQLPESERADLLVEAVAAVPSIGWDEDRAYALGALARQMPESKREELLSEALDAALAVDMEDAREDALERVAPELARLPAGKLYPLWRKWLHLSATRGHYELLGDMRVGIAVVLTLGGPAAAEETAQAIQEAGRWWP